MAASDPAAAGSIEVTPTTIDLPAASDTAVFYITNRGDAPTVTQIQGFDWRQSDGGDRLAPSATLTISPPMARLAPGQQQIVRLAVEHDAAIVDERTFRLLVSELPDASVQTGGVRVLLQFSVPVFKPGANPGEASLSWELARSPEGLFLTARNAGARHVKLIDLAFALAGRKPVAIAPATFIYVLARASHRWTIPGHAFKTGEPLHVTGRDDNSGAAIDTSLAVPP